MSKSKWAWVIAALTVLTVIGLTVAVETGNTTWGEINGLFWFAVVSLIAVAGYFLPSIIAGKRHHRSTAGIVALNVLAGWTFLGWLIALVWSLSSPQQIVVQPAPVQYQTGDIVNGHRFNGQTWEPV